MKCLEAHFFFWRHIFFLTTVLCLTTVLTLQLAKHSMMGGISDRLKKGKKSG